MNLNDLTLEISQEVLIKAPVERAFQSLLKGLTEENPGPGGKPLMLTLEPWPGGRWYRDLGDKQGHLWGFVQVIKPPTLLEITGPMVMSYPATNHLQFRLTPTESGTKLTLAHRAFGLILDDHRKGMAAGWEWILNRVREIAEA